MRRRSSGERFASAESPPDRYAGQRLILRYAWRVLMGLAAAGGLSWILGIEAIGWRVALAAIFVALEIGGTSGKDAQPRLRRRVRS
jgi:hypothetical protein